MCKGGRYARLFWLMLLLLFSTASFAQEVEPGRSFSVDFGARGCFDINVSGCSGTDANPAYGGGGGAVVRISRGAHLFAETGLLLAYDDLLVGAKDSRPELRLDKFSAHVPVDFGYKFGFIEDMDFFVAVGIDLSANIAGKVRSYGEQERMPSFGDAWRRFNVGCGFGAGFIMGRMSVSIMGYYGLIPMSKLSDERITDNVVRVGATYYFGHD